MAATSPPDLDAEFAALAQPQWRVLPQRVVNVWFAPYNSAGWPISLNPPPGSSTLALVASHPLVAAVKASTALYRAALPLVALVLAIWAGGWVRTLLVAALAYAAVQTVSHAAFGFIDTRYLLTSSALLETAILFGLVAWLRRAVPDGTLTPAWSR
jgi:hypothetical protein